jgi:hypothetical protein
VLAASPILRNPVAESTAVRNDDVAAVAAKYLFALTSAESVSAFVVDTVNVLSAAMSGVATSIKTKRKYFIVALMEELGNHYQQI